ncbi:MAG: hypothetical protein LH481_03295 [Burkholderiales bacterium]|nr:hypothetical protein [Burkholderiales bacterium]
MTRSVVHLSIEFVYISPVCEARVWRTFSLRRFKKASVAKFNSRTTKRSPVKQSKAAEGGSFCEGGVH